MQSSSSSHGIVARNKTRRAGSPSGDGSSAAENPAAKYGMSPDLEQFLNLNASEAYKRPWHRLERGLRLNRLRRFIETETSRMRLQVADVDHLTNLLHRALDRKLLNSKTAVIYNPEKEEIEEIKGLVYHRTADGKIVSQIVEKKASMTVRRKKTEGGKAEGSKAEKSESTTAVAIEPPTS